MTPSAQLPLAAIPAPDGEVVEVVASYRGFDAEVPMRWSLLVRLDRRAPGAPLVEPLVATVIEGGADVPQDEIAEMWANQSFRVEVTRDAYAAAVRRRNPRRSP